VQEYCYLGCVLRNDLELSRMALDRVKKAESALNTMGPFLRSRSIPLATKWLVINSIITPMLLFGAELWGMNKLRSHKADTLLAKALRWCIGASGSSSSGISSVALREEFTIPSIGAMASARRARAWAKFPRLRTWISTLIENPFPNRKQTWVNGTPAWINRVGPRVDNIREAVCLLKPKRTENLWYTMVKRHAYQREQIGTKAISWVNYEKTAMTKTNQWLQQSPLSWPQLTGGCINLLRCRIGAFWTAEKLVLIGKLSAHYSHICPFCLERQPETIPHRIVTCLAWSVERQRYLGALLERIVRACLRCKVGNRLIRVGFLSYSLGGSLGHCLFRDGVIIPIRKLSMT